jgi:hypothetical protein
MNNTEYLAFCRKELKRSKKWRASKHYQYDDQWRRYIDLYQGKMYDEDNDVDQLTVNMIFATKNVMAPAVAINNPRFVVNARKPDNAPQAVITEEVLNYLWRTHKYQSEFRLAVDDWLLIGHGWLKVGYKFVKEPKEKTPDGSASSAGSGEGLNNRTPKGTGTVPGLEHWGKTWDSSENAKPTSSVGAGINGDELEEGIDDREDVEGNVESELNVDDDRPFLERISPFDMYVDPDARHPKEMRWIAQRTWRAVADVHVDSRYSATNRKRVSGSSWSRWDGGEGQDARSAGEKADKGSVTFAEVIEFYDIKRKKVCTFATQDDESSMDDGFLIKPQKMPYAFGHPFVMLRNYEVPDHFYPLGDVGQIESLQLELNETRNQMLNYRKKFRRAWVYSEDRFDRKGVQALESDVDNVMIPVMGDADPSTAIAPVPTVITPPEFFDQSAMITNDLDRVSGVSDYQRGAQTAIKRTATEAAMIQDAANARAQDRLAKVESILAEVAERVIGLMQQFLTGEQTARIVTMPVKGWINYDPSRIAGQFDYEVVGGSTEPQNETFRRQSAMQLADISSLFMQAGVVNAPALFQELLQKGFGIKDASRFIQQQPPPEQAPPPAGGAPGAGPPDMGAAPPMPGMQAPPQELTPELFAQMAGMGGAPEMPGEEMM